MELWPEHVVDGPYWPDQQDGREHTADEVVRSPPALDTRSVDAKNRLTDRQGTVIPNQHEHEYQVYDSETITYQTSHVVIH